MAPLKDIGLPEESDDGILTTREDVYHIIDTNSTIGGDDSNHFSTKLKSSVGGPSTFLRTANERRRRQRRKQVTVYEPTHRWWEPPLRMWIPKYNREIQAALFLYYVVFTFMAKYTLLCGVPEAGRESANDFCSDDWFLLDDKVLSGFATGMFLLLAFRASQAYDRWWEARRLWGRTREVCRDFARLICNHVECTTDSDRADRRRAIDFLTAFGVALKLHVLDERHIVRDLTEQGTTIGTRLTMNMQDIANLQQSRHMPLFCLDILSDYLTKQVKAGKLSDYQLGVINTTVMAVLSGTLGSCERIRNTPIPLSYVLQLRFCMMLWLVLYPLNVVTFYGWYTILLASLVGYAVLGIDSMASEIENPFGYDRNDLNLDQFCQGFCQDTQDILERHEAIDRDLLFDRKKVADLGKSQFFPPSAVMMG
jgi:ion channel-forming bestrophin family protein